MESPSTWSRLVYDDNELVGLIQGRPGTDPDTNKKVEGREHISLLMVRPDHWGKGIGSGLLDWIFEDMKSKGFKEISLWTETDNQLSRPLYERKGFKLTGNHRLCPDPLRPDPQVHYLKQL
jgi:ribosomal protein S18 acetylase RimI-like enzyme